MYVCTAAMQKDVVLATHVYLQHGFHSTFSRIVVGTCGCKVPHSFDFVGKGDTDICTYEVVIL